MIGRYAELVWYRAWAELRSEASRAYLGTLWWVLEPVLQMGVFYVVFGLGLRHGEEGFVAFLLCGLVPWKWLDGSVRAASNSISFSVGLMQQVYLPKLVLPLIVMLQNSIKFLIVLAILMAFLAWDGVASFRSWGYLPFLLLSQALMVGALGLWAAALVPLLPDLRFVIVNGMSLLFFMSGVFFRFEYLDPKIQAWLHYNPVLVLLENYRQVLLYGKAPEWVDQLTIDAWMLVVAVAAILFMHRLDRYYPRVVG